MKARDLNRLQAMRLRKPQHDDAGANFFGNQKSCEFIIFLLFLTECAIIIYNAVSVVIDLGSMAI